jgi:hypothetical membrane protein
MNRARLGASAGIGAAFLITLGWIVGGLVQGAGYSWSRQEISDLGALTAQHPWVWNLADSASGLLILVFAFGLLAVVRSSRAGWIGAGLIAVVGLGSVIDGVLREDCALSTSEACQRLQDDPGLSWHHQAHDVESVIVVATLLAAPFVMAKAFRRVDALRGLRGYSLATGVAAVAATVAYVPLYGDPGGGIAQRVLILISMAWIAVISVSMLRSISTAGTPSG